MDSTVYKVPEQGPRGYIELQNVYILKRSYAVFRILCASSKCFLKTVRQVLVFNFIIIMITRPFQFTSFLDENSFNQITLKESYQAKVIVYNHESVRDFVSLLLFQKNYVLDSMF